ncbi:putative RNA helicase [Martiniozyma asiatica (nom. inval.)]|nr:putative RNA helicase [Martiniozyma asiatica]
MREKLSEFEFPKEDDAFRLPVSLLDESSLNQDHGKSDFKRNLMELIKSFGELANENLLDFEKEEEEEEEEEDDDDYESSDEFLTDPAGDFFLLNEIKQECVNIYKRQVGENNIDNDTVLFDTIINILKEHKDDVALQSAMFDVLGFDQLELISRLITSKSLILKEYDQYNEKSQIKNSNGLMTQEEIKAQVQETARKARNQKLQMANSPDSYPHVYQSFNAGNMVSFSGKRYALPAGSTREIKDDGKSEEIIIPKSEHRNSFVKDIPVYIRDMDFICKGTFKGYKRLNRMQSLIYDVGYNTNENMLVCAPTGAGKTDVALLTILHTIKQFVTESESVDGEGLNIDIDYDEFKIVYVAPLKALAAEIVEKFSTKLAWLGIQVRELTGDMQLTRSEIMSTQIIVTTPEKWDVVTRKSNGDTELVEKVKLLIIDEVHLLHEDRGSVIETLVARTLRQVESTQSMIRIVGLSATLPNFVDVADFLGVNRKVGMFYFDQSFRPVPLEQQLIGVKGKAGSKQSRENLEEISYNKVTEMLKFGHQVMVFVHSRKDTIKTARNYIKMCGDNFDMDLFDCKDTDKYEFFQREMSKNKNKDIRELFAGGFGVHHAGMSRADRNLTEKMFLSGAINVLVCTATLAWGVNLPAAAVVIKGTQVYDSKQGGFVDLGISDVIQIFGRAGRPQFEAHGIGILCTSADRLDHYVSLLLQQHPIESKLSAKLVDNLNAEISLGTVTNVDEGVQWLGYTYLYVRMRKNPFAYGIDWNELQNDKMLVQRRRELIMEAARKLHKLQMIVFDEKSTGLIAKDIGRIASDFYLLNESVEIFNAMINPEATEADVLGIISMSSEFDNIKFRDEEQQDLDKLRHTKVICEVGKQLEDSQKKTNILLQAFISKAFVTDSALASDMNYIAQNAARICRSLFLMGLNRRWGVFTRHILEICKAVDKQIWPFNHPMTQFDLQPQIIKQIEARNPSMESLREMDASELGDLVHNAGMGKKLYKMVGRFPYLLLDVECFPITTNVMRIHVVIDPDFIWNFEYHGNAQFFWILVESSDDSNILHFEKFILSKKSFSSPHELDFMIPLSDPPPQQIVVRAVSDSWIGGESAQAVSFKHLIKPHNDTVRTKLLKLHPLPIKSLHDEKIVNIYKNKFSYFNPMQTMTFHTLYNSNSSVFVGSPTGSGKTVVAELAIWHAFNEFPGSKVVYIAPMKALVRERVDDWRERIQKNTSHKIVEMTGDSLPGSNEVREADIIITTPEKFDGISRNWQSRKFVQEVSLIIMDEIHLLASDRGPILEIIVSRMNYISSYTKRPIRLLGLSTAVSNAMDMASWLGVKEGLFNFPQSVRPVPLKMYIDGFPDNLAFCPLMKTMNKPAFMAIKQHSPTKPVLIFVASRRQTRLTALDLIHLCGMEENPRRFLKMSEAELEAVASKVKDDTLKLSLQFGIGLHHAGLVESDRQISHKLFEQNKIQILIATSTLAWGVNLPAHLVIIKGTQFFDAKIEGYRDMDLTDILQMMGRAGRPAFDTSGIAMVYTKESKKTFYKHFLNVGFPVESSLHKVMDNHIGAEISSGTIKTRQEAMDFLTWTFLYRRAHHNPTYYGIEDQSQEGISKYLSGLVDNVIENLIESKCLISFGEKLNPTPFLQISSYYYLSHKTLRNLLNKVEKYATFRQCLRWLCEATEYDELPTRHGEELINMEMSQQMRYPADDLEEYEFIWDPHIKSFLLLQAYMSRVELPIADYSQDTISVLDQSLRILQAYIDATSELGYLSTTLIFIKLMQCIKQKCWFDDDFVYSLPGLSLQKLPHNEDCYDEDGSQWRSSMPDPKINLKKIGSMKTPELNKLATKLHIDSRKRDQFIKVASTLTTGKFSVSQLSTEELLVELVHENKIYKKDYHIYAPNFSKSQRETWFAIICNLDTDELFSTKRISPRRVGKEDKATGKLQIRDDLKGKKLDVLLVSDFTDLFYQTKHTFA